MDIKDIISSGLLEDYVLGQCSDQEISLVECLSKSHPQVQQYIYELEQSLEKSLSFNSNLKPSAQLKQNIMELIEGEEQESPLSTVKASSESASAVSSAPQRSGKVRRFPWVAAAATFALLAVVIHFWNQNKLQKSQESLAAVQEERDALLELKGVTTSPEYTRLTLAGVEAHPESEVQVFYNASSKETYVNLVDLPPAPEGKQYQFWSIENGSPVDLGMLPINHESGQLVPVKRPGSPAAFAITLEKEGGVPSPTMEAMYVFGEA